MNEINNSGLNIEQYMDINEKGEKNEGIAYDLEPQIRYDIPDCPVALVSGDPFQTAEKLDWNQGDNPYNARGNCGLVSISNILQLSGKDIKENDVTLFALRNNLCNNGWFLPAEARGGVNDEQIIAILDHYGIEAKIYPSSEAGGDYESIAQAIENGQGVTMGVNAGYLWDNPNYIFSQYGEPSPANHQIIVTESVRDAETGNVIGFFICDSGRGLETDGARYVSVDLLNDAYINTINGSVIITNDSIRTK